MILVFELTWTGTSHAPGNSATIQTVARAFPGQAVRVHADLSHVEELRRDAALAGLANVSLAPVTISPLFSGKTHVVSGRRFAHELAVLRAALRAVPPDEPCLLFLISATPTSIAAAQAVLRFSRRPLGVQVGLHGNLNEIVGWRPRNPLIRRYDLAGALGRPPPRGLRYLVLEESIRAELARLSPAAARHTDVLPLPINLAERPDGPTAGLTAPVRIGLVGQATRAKGIDSFLAVAEAITATHGAQVEFHHVGRVTPGADLSRFAVLASPPVMDHLPRAEFARRLGALHFVLLPFQEGYYNLSASGALIDAITWLKPIIATDVPMARHFFAEYGDIGYLCDGEAGLTAAVTSILRDMDAARYQRQVAALARVRDKRRPEALAETYRTSVRDGFGGLLA